MFPGLILVGLILTMDVTSWRNIVVTYTPDTEFHVTVNGVQPPGSPWRSDDLGILVLEFDAVSPVTVHLETLSVTGPSLVCGESER